MLPVPESAEEVADGLVLLQRHFPLQVRAARRSFLLAVWIALFLTSDPYCNCNNVYLLFFAYFQKLHIISKAIFFSPNYKMFKMSSLKLHFTGAQSQ